ncbi:50S ribosomal protein L11 methyltransferase [Muribaculum sp. NM65_B17]|jgi:ribosomal protein L11 methyltransferase|uniref:50S ribosomal protein L11 methyltransferase n=1 Tax=unclassified Muribaculum TaxID=2622126 RepID=UPI000F476A4C|nr:50S ribosomal protein L11 methyltransferase [Muribaculum sp. NM65_B17]ROT13679.1 50S ribosomal protein L11 methyltransferase [Muribaculaceae bacterium Isolate-102 (HZI)]TGY03689.1 50S ribosomal protein L11 methyltransferase [Muribaculum sp. NM65_B17]THG42440.1 50S ribosomal protein L11 methyltransferase [Muribaculaceae bacterium]
MNDYTEVRIDMSPCNETMTDVMAALLCEHGYESFVPDENGMTAYIKLEDFDKKVLDEVTAELPFDTSVTVKCETVEGRDWNQEWEKNYFKPITVDGKCVIHSSFHTDIPSMPYDIVIDPKMAFGTGHHQTTTLIILRLLELPLEGSSVIDMGTGTGILAILAAMRGAGPVTAIEIDEFAHVNAVENVSLNRHPEINVVLGDASALAGVEPVDLFLANINRNIIVGDLQVYASRLKEGGTMLLSGFYEDDIAIVLDEARKHGLEYVGHTVLERWSCLELKK